MGSFAYTEFDWLFQTRLVLNVIWLVKPNLQANQKADIFTLKYFTPEVNGLRNWQDCLRVWEHEVQVQLLSSASSPLAPNRYSILLG